jgi:hypothetical protein
MLKKLKMFLLCTIHLNIVRDQVSSLWSWWNDGWWYWCSSLSIISSHPWDVTISNSGATILRLLEVQHPARQGSCGTRSTTGQGCRRGTTSVVIFADWCFVRASLVKAKYIPPQSSPATVLLRGCKEFIQTKWPSKLTPLEEIVTWKRSQNQYELKDYWKVCFFFYIFYSPSVA